MPRVIRQEAAPDDAKAFEAEEKRVVRSEATPDEAKAFEAAGEPGAPGHNQYARSSSEENPRRDEPVTPGGTVWDTAKSWANTAALKGGPKISGAIGAALQSALNNDEAANALWSGRSVPKAPSAVDVYQSVRDDTAGDLAASGRTSAGQIGNAIGLFSTPVPVKALGPTATPAARALQAGTVGGTMGATHAAFTSDVDLTKPNPDMRRFIAHVLLGGGSGFAAGAGAGYLTAKAGDKLRSTAEEQALRAAGLEAGIKNSIKKDLGLSNMTEARQLGRQFLDEGLIPPVGSSEAVAERAQGLQGRSGNAIGSTLSAAEVSGAKLDAAQNADAVRRFLDSQSAVATDLSGAKAYSLADALERQGTKTPGSFIGQNQAKSDAWKSANFAADAPMAPQLYRKAVGAARDDIESQVGAALGPDAAATLNEANRKYGVAADALKLAENASTRSAARKGFTTADALALLSGGTAGGFAGHPGAGAGVGLGLVLGKKGFDKYGHSTAARFSDFLAKQAEANTGGATAVNALQPYLDLLEQEPEK